MIGQPWENGKIMGTMGQPWDFHGDVHEDFIKKNIEKWGCDDIKLGDFPQLCQSTGGYDIANINHPLRLTINSGIH